MIDMIDMITTDKFYTQETATPELQSHSLKDTLSPVYKWSKKPACLS